MATEALRVRPGEGGDVRRLAEIEHQASANPWSLSQFVSGSLLDHEYSLVLESADGSLLGFAIYQRVLDEATLMNIAVMPEQQGRGHGDTLLVGLLHKLSADGIRRCLLEVRANNTPAIALYRKHGFVDEGVRKDYYPSPAGREDALLMSCPLGEEL